MTKSEINLRAIIYVLISFLTPIQTTLAAGEQLTSAVWLSSVVAALITWRAFLDKSPAQGESAAPVEVEVTNTPANAVPVDDTGEGTG